jgi:hypothetical protein
MQAQRAHKYAEEIERRQGRKSIKVKEMSVDEDTATSADVEISMNDCEMLDEWTEEDLGNTENYYQEEYYPEEDYHYDQYGENGDGYQHGEWETPDNEPASNNYDPVADFHSRLQAASSTCNSSAPCETTTTYAPQVTIDYNHDAKETGPPSKSPEENTEYVVAV